jgi:hypothetical protein
MNIKDEILIAPLLEECNTLIIYRQNGEEPTVKLNLIDKTMKSNLQLNIDEVNYIRAKFLFNNEK